MAIYEQDDVARMNYRDALLGDGGALSGSVTAGEALLLDHITQINREADCTME